MDIVTGALIAMLLGIGFVAWLIHSLASALHPPQDKEVAREEEARRKLYKESK